MYGFRSESSSSVSLGARSRRRYRDHRESVADEGRWQTPAFGERDVVRRGGISMRGVQRDQWSAKRHAQRGSLRAPRNRTA